MSYDGDLLLRCSFTCNHLRGITWCKPHYEEVHQKNNNDGRDRLKKAFDCV
jgi:hypothetical protein